MKKALILVLMLSPFLYCQNSVDFFNSQSGIVAADDGVIYKTSNGDVGWLYRYSGSMKMLKSVYHTDSLTAFCVGQTGEIIKTTNGGDTWIWLNSGTNYDLFTLVFIDKNIGFAAGKDGIILKTSNAGENWQINQPPGIVPTITSLFFVNNEVGFAAAERYFLKTTNGGMSWTSKRNSSSMRFRSIFFIDSTTGFGGSSEYIYKTTDGGETWFRFSQQLNSSVRMLLFTSKDTAFAATDFGIIRTIDGAATWEYIWTEQLINSICFTDAITGYAVGPNMILKTSDGGETWIKQVTEGVPSNIFNFEERWLVINELLCPFNNSGSFDAFDNVSKGFQNVQAWPSQYGFSLSTIRSKSIWIGSRNFNDPVEKRIKTVKVIGSGPMRGFDFNNQLFNAEIKLVGKKTHPHVIVDNIDSYLSYYDTLDSINTNMDCDRMVVIKYNTSLGVSVTQKVKAFTQSNHDNYFIYDYVFKNTGVTNKEGTTLVQTLNDVMFYFNNRHAFGIEGSYWSQGAFSSTWGASSLYHAFGENPLESEYNDYFNTPMRGFYSYYGPNKDSFVSYDEDWGAPNQTTNGYMASSRYAGTITLHADKNSEDHSDNLFQPSTTWYVSPDQEIMERMASQYNESFMQKRYDIMSEGHPDIQHDEYIGEKYANELVDPLRNGGGGSSQGLGYGPYNISHGDSIHIVFADAVSGISQEKNLEVGGNWFKWYNNDAGKPELFLPDGSQTTDHNLYKKTWVQTGKDSLLKTFRNAIYNYAKDYKIPQSPPPPDTFKVKSGGDFITLSWSNNAANYPYFNGYEIYRSVNLVMDPRAVYEKIFECTKENAVHAFQDTNVYQGSRYYYFIQTRDDGTQNEIEAGVPLYSSLFLTLTKIPATSEKPVYTEFFSPLPNDFELLQNYPNPFNPVTNLEFRIPITAMVEIKVYDLLGREVEILLKEEKPAGQYRISFDASNLSSGVYYYKLKAGDFISVRKMLLIK